MGKLKTSVPEITDNTESNPFVILIGFFAGLVEQLNYYIDSMAREAFLDTARLYSSVVKISRFMGYYGRTAVGSWVEISLQFKDNSGNLVVFTNSWTLPQGTRFQTTDGLSIFITQKAYTFVAGQNKVIVDAKNSIPVASTVIGITQAIANYEFEFEQAFECDHKTLAININGQTWTQVDSFSYSKTTDKHYIVYLGTNGLFYLRFGNNINGAIPPDAQNINATYNSTAGDLLNTLQPGLLTASPTNILSLVTGPTVLEITNEATPAGGQTLESIDILKRNAVINLRTLNRAVTYQDYFDLLQVAPGVAKGEIDFCCSNGNGVVMYIVPEGGGIAAGSLLTSVADYFDKLKIIGTKVTITPAGPLLISVEVEVVAFAGTSQTEVQTTIQNALIEYFSYLNQEINGAVRKAELITLISNLSPIDYVKNLIINYKPYPRPINHSIALNWTRVIKTTSSGINKYSLLFQGGTGWQIYKNGVNIGSYTTGDTYSDTDIEFVISSAAYLSGQEWKFTTYPYNLDIITEDFTIPTLDSTTLSIDVSGNQVGLRTKNC